MLAAVVGAALVAVAAARVRHARDARRLAAGGVARTARSTPSASARKSGWPHITQGLKNPGLLERVVKEEGLDKNTPTNDAINALDRRTTIAIPPADPNLPPGTIIQFTVQYRDDTPEKTQRVANRLAELFVEDSSMRREMRAEDTSAFVGMQLAESQTRLNELEGRLRTAKESFMGALPEQTNANVAMVTGLQQQLETTANAIRGEQDRLSVIERQIEGMKAGATSEVAVPGLPATASPAAVRVVTLERELAVARGNYTDRHPEIVRLPRGAVGGAGGGGGRGQPAARRADHRAAHRSELPRAHRRPGAGAAPHPRPAAQQVADPRRRSGCIARASTRRRGSSSRLRRCSASTTSRNSSTPS